MKNTLRRILSLWRPHRWLAVGLAAALLLRTLFTVVLALSIKLIIDGVVEGPDDRSRAGIVALLLSGYAVSFGAAIVAGYVEATAGARILVDVRTAVFEHLQRLPVAYHARVRAGDVLSRFSTDVEGLQRGAVKKPRQALQSALALALFLPVMVTLEWRLALVTVVAIPIAIGITNRLTPDTAGALDEEKRLLADVLDEVSENVQAQPIIRAFGLHRRASERFGARMERLRAGSTRAQFRIQVLSAASEFAVSFVQLAVVGLGAILALNGDLAAGSFAAFVALLTEFAWESTVIAGDVLPEIASAGSGIRRIDELLATEAAGSDDSGTRPPPSFDDSIRFEDVSFGYGADGGRQLDGFTLDLPARSSISIVGGSGSGKTTLLNLLLRFYDPDDGRILVDAVDLRDVDLARYRDQVGVVFQDTFLFNVSLRENIRIACAGATDEEVEAAARAAGLSDVLAGLADGIDSLVGPEGRRLSGGQRQRIGIARAVLRSPSLLLLDEVTSALDPVTEQAVNHTLRRLQQGRTVISVTHRLGAVMDADLIVVMQEGRPVEQGTFDQLQAAGGAFSAMWEKQSGFRISPDGRAGEISPDRLRAIPLFAGLEEQLLPGLADRFVADHFTAGENIFSEGDPADRFHVIARGVTEVLRRIDGREQVIAHLEDGDFFGEMAFLDDAPRNATIRAVTPTLTLSLDRTQFEEFLAAAPTAADLVREVAEGRAGAPTSPDHG